MDNVHVLPVNDLKPHEEQGLECHCNPKIEKQESGAFVVTHKSYDFREYRENKKSSN